jgi:hypothetical protein
MSTGTWVLQESPAVVYPPGPWQPTGAPPAVGYESEGDQKLTRVLSDFRKQQVRKIKI